MTAAIEGEVVTLRRRERNAVRSVDVLPPDVETKVVALQRLDGAAQVAQVTAMLSHSRTGLLAAIAAQDLPEIVMWKAKASAIQDMAKQLQLGRDLQLDAAEFVRRAERGLGVAIRDGQASGSVNGIGNHDNRGNGSQSGRNHLTGSSKKSPLDFAPAHELQGANRAGEGIYAMTDGVSDEAFEQALAEAKEEENLSRANVARKSRARSETVIDAEPVAVRPKSSGPKHNSTEMVENIAGMLQSIVQTLGYIETADVDRQTANSVLPQIFAALRTIRKTAKEIQDVD